MVSSRKASRQIAFGQCLDTVASCIKIYGCSVVPGVTACPVTQGQVQKLSNIQKSTRQPSMFQLEYLATAILF